MSEHPNATRLRDGYAAFGKGDLAALDELFAEDIRWHEPGRNPLAGERQGRAAVYELLGRIMEVTGGTLRLDVHTVLADDTDGVAVVTVSGSRGDRRLESLNAHIWRFSGGRAVEFREAMGDQYTFDELLG